MRKALFLDRDGVLNFDDGYTHIWKEDLLIPGVCELIRRFKGGGFMAIVVTNQSGIGRGLYDESSFLTFMREMRTTLGKYDADIDSFYFCGCGPSDPSCYFRKPNPGMLLKAIEDFAIDPLSSVMVGDKVSDMQAASNAGINKKYLFHIDGGSILEDDINEDMVEGFKITSSLDDVDWV